MRLASTISLHAGGQGSGCHGPNCGRSGGGEHKPDSSTTPARSKGVSLTRGYYDKDDPPEIGQRVRISGNVENGGRVGEVKELSPSGTFATVKVSGKTGYYHLSDLTPFRKVKK